MIEGSSEDGREMIGTTLCKHQENIGTTSDQHRVCNGTAGDLPTVNKGFPMLLPICRGVGRTKLESASLIAAPYLSSSFVCNSLIEDYLVDKVLRYKSECSKIGNKGILV